MDTTVKPQDDFYLYANGGWLKHNPVPPEYSRWGSFSELEEKNNEALHKIAEKAENTRADATTAPEIQKVGDYYASGMDEKTIESARTKPLEDELKRIDAIKDRSDLLNAIARLHTIGVDAFFQFGSGQDAKDSAREIAQAVQGGLGLPDRDYYIKTDEDSNKKRAAYIEHVTKMLTLLGETPDPKLVLELSNELHVTARTPPTFLFHTADDAGVPVENSLAFFQALHAAQVPAELHVFPKGPHGVGLAADDPAVSITHAACSVMRRNACISVHESAIQFCTVCLSASTEPAVYRVSARSHSMSSARWHWPSQRMQ